MRHVAFDVADLPAGLQGVTGEVGDTPVVLLSRQLDRAGRRCALAHELHHLERGGSGHQAGLPPHLAELVAREERAVDRLVVDELVPLPDLQAFVAEIEEGGGLAWPSEVAEHFDVTLEVALMALDRLRR